MRTQLGLSESMNALMKKLFMKCLGGAALLALASCSSVTMKQSLPNNLPKEERVKFVGQWLPSGPPVSVNFTSSGVGKVASLPWSEKEGRFIVDERSFVVTKIGEDLYLSGPSWTEGLKGEYLLKCAFVEGDLLMWAPNLKRFEELVASKKISGTMSRNGRSKNLAISNSPAEIMSILESEKGLFLYETPTILRKIPTGN